MSSRRYLAILGTEASAAAHTLRDAKTDVSKSFASKTLENAGTRKAGQTLRLGLIHEDDTDMEESLFQVHRLKENSSGVYES